MLTRSLAGNRKVSAAVKGDAYGHGMTQCAQVLAECANGLAVAFCEEASQLLEAGFDCPINILEGPFDKDDATFIANNRLETVIHSPGQLDLLISAGLQAESMIWLKIDTGMHRLGLDGADIEILLRQLERSGHRRTGLMSHLGDAESPESPMTKMQIQRWRATVEPHSLPTSLLNSAGILESFTVSSDWVRPGILLYGAGGQTNKAEEKFIPVMQLKSSVMAIRRVPAGEFVGYSGRWQAERESRVATVPVGYGDGYPRTAANGTPVLISGQRCPLVGHVSMDMITVDVTDHPSVAVGSPVELWGQHLPVNDVAAKADTIGYELLTRLPDRAARRWIT